MRNKIKTKLVRAKIFQSHLILISFLAGTESYLGCFYDRCPRAGCPPDGGLYKLVLTYLIQRSGAMTTVKCINLCLDSSYDSMQYAGVEARTFCYCGIGGVNYTALGQRDDSDCNVPCLGDSSQMCGSDFAIAVYDCKC